MSFKCLLIYRFCLYPFPPLLTRLQFIWWRNWILCPIEISSLDFLIAALWCYLTCSSTICISHKLILWFRYLIRFIFYFLGANYFTDYVVLPCQKELSYPGLLKYLMLTTVRIGDREHHRAEPWGLSKLVGHQLWGKVSCRGKKMRLPW